MKPELRGPRAPCCPGARSGPAVTGRNVCGGLCALAASGRYGLRGCTCQPAAGGGGRGRSRPRGASTEQCTVQSARARSGRRPGCTEHAPRQHPAPRAHVCCTVHSYTRVAYGGARARLPRWGARPGGRCARLRCVKRARSCAQCSCRKLNPYDTVTVQPKYAYYCPECRGVNRTSRSDPRAGRRGRAERRPPLAEVNTCTAVRHSSTFDTAITDIPERAFRAHPRDRELYKTNR